MNKSLLTLGALALAFSASATCLKEGETVAFFDDAISRRGWQYANNYAKLCEYAFGGLKLKVKCVDASAKTPETSAGLLKRLQKDVLDKKPTYVLVSCGVNDVHLGKKGVALPQFKENMTKIVEGAQAAGIKVILLTATMIGEDETTDENRTLTHYNEAVRELAKAKNCTLVDVHAAMKKQVEDYRARAGITRPFLTVDGHFMDYLGNVLMAKTILKDGFTFTADEMTRSEKPMLGPRTGIKIDRGEAEIGITGVSIDGTLYVKIVEKALAAKLTPAEFLNQKFGAYVNKQASRVYRENCRLAPEPATLSTEPADLPIWDISNEAARQTIIAAGTEKIYHAHPSTVRVPEDGTIYAVWTYEHGGKAGPIAESKDDGKTWTRIDARMPEAYAKEFFNCPCIYRIVAPDGKARLIIFANRTVDKKRTVGYLTSDDNGKTWQVRPPLPFVSWMPPTALIRLKDGSTAIFGQELADASVKTDRPSDDQVIWMSVSKDGGLTWSDKRVVAKADKRNLCEPFALRSDDGNEIALLLRENRHRGNAMMCFSRDEGKTWTKPVETCRGLSGDRHQGVKTKDGRWVIAFRDQAVGSPTRGQFFAWVGTYDDIRHARPGQFRIHLLKHCQNNWDSGYPGMELLDDGTILATTYLKYAPDNRKHSVVMTRFKLDEYKK